MYMLCVQGGGEKFVPSFAQAVRMALDNNHTDAVALAITSAFVAGGAQAIMYNYALADVAASSERCMSIAPVVTRKHTAGRIG
jgi:hypothetical protein